MERRMEKTRDMETYEIVSKDGKQAIFDREGRQVSDWFDRIYYEGLVRGQSDYYVAESNGKQAIFDVNGNQISDWHDEILEWFYYGLLLGGNSQYYVASDEATYIYHIDKGKIFQIPDEAPLYALQHYVDMFAVDWEQEIAKLQSLVPYMKIVKDNKEKIPLHYYGVYVRYPDFYAITDVAYQGIHNPLMQKALEINDNQLIEVTIWSDVIEIGHQKMLDKGTISYVNDIIEQLIVLNDFICVDLLHLKNGFFVVEEIRHHT